MSCMYDMHVSCKQPGVMIANMHSADTLGMYTADMYDMYRSMYKEREERGVHL